MLKDPLFKHFFVITMEKDKPRVSPHDSFIPKVREKEGIAEDHVALFQSQPW